MNSTINFWTKIKTDYPNAFNKWVRYYELECNREPKPASFLKDPTDEQLNDFFMEYTGAVDYLEYQIGWINKFIYKNIKINDLLNMGIDFGDISNIEYLDEEKLNNGYINFYINCFKFLN